MRQDKGSVDVTYLRKAIVSGNCRIEPRSEVLKILTDGNKVTGVLVAKNQSIETRYADIVILACGSVQTPRLLLNSADPTSPDGLSNESGLVGRNLMETLLTTTSALHPERLGSHRGLPVDWVAWDYNKPNAIPNVIGGCRFGPAMSESDLVGPVAYATRIVEGWGTEHKQNMRDVFGRVLSIAAIGESLPNNATFVDLADEQDAFGLPVARIHSQLSEMDIARLRFMTGKCREIIAAAGCTDIVEEFSSVDAFSSTHIFGTCRSGVAPDQSVVDSFCRSHRWRNLLVTDSSVFPSSGGGESPGLTIQALAIRAVDNLIRTGAE
jgi:choline dehydrogenase-like flavoprotein